MAKDLGFIKELKKKDPKALDYLVDNYSNLIFKIANGILNDRELSKECVNDVILKIWNNSKSFNREENKFNLWVMAISKYTAIDMLRKEKKHYGNEELDSAKITYSHNIEEKIINNEAIEGVRNQINKMSAVDKEIFLKKFFEEKSSKEVAEELGVTEKFINLRIFRGRKKLKEGFSNERS